MSSYGIGLSALTANQGMLDLIGQNIANANTPGYHKQDAVLTARRYNMGVDIASLQRRVSSVLEGALTRSIYQASTYDAHVEGMNQVQSLLAPGEGSLVDLVEKFFNQAEQLTQQPDSLTQRRSMLSIASAMTDRINTTVNELDRLEDSMVIEGQRVVEQINTHAARVAELNGQIEQIDLQRGNTNDLRDQRDYLINQMAELIDVRAVELAHGVVNVTSTGLALVVGSNAKKLFMAVDSNDQAVLTTDPSLKTPLPVSGGKIQGMLALRNSSLPAIREKFDEFAKGLVTQIDGIHAQGVGLRGPMANVAGSRAVDRTNIPLAATTLSYPPTRGELVVGMTNLATGERTQHVLNIDPTSQSLQDVANALSTIPNLQGIVDSQNRTLRVISTPGYGFDFSGHMATRPETSTITGTSQPTVTGRYTGTDNDLLDFRVVGSGTVGVTQPLSLEVRNSAGTLLRSVNIGLGYQPNSEIDAGDGILVKLPTGTVNNGENFTVRVVSNSDTGNLLTSLGLNTFFEGDDSSGLKVRPDLMSNPEHFNASTTGRAADNANLLRIVNLRDSKNLTQGTETFSQFLTSMIGQVGSQIQDLQIRQTASRAVSDRMRAEQQAYSGVDPNEEAVKMLQYQRAFQMSARYITAVNEAFDSLLNLA